MAELPVDKYARDDDVDLQELFSALWQGKWLIILITVCFSAGGVIYALSQPDIYHSEVVLAPIAEENTGGLTGLAGQFGGLASMAGLNLGMSSVDKATLATEVLKSRAFVLEFIRRHDLSIPLIAAESWDHERSRWILDSKIYDEESNTWVRKVAPPRTSEPSDGELFDAFSNGILTVEKNNKTFLVKIGVNSMSPIAAQQWAMWLVDDLNQHMRRLDIDEAQRSIEYLNNQIVQISNATMQKIFYQLIEQQTKVSMLAQVRTEYVFRIVDPAFLPELKTSPKRAQICVLFALLGGIFSSVVVLIRHYRRK